MKPDEILDRNLAALLRAAGPAATSARTAEACDVFLRRLAPRRPPRLAWAAASLFFAAGLAVVLVDSGSPRVGAPRDPAEVDRWIAELAHESVEIREAAAAKLEGLGLDVEYALAELERRKGSPDPETARRAALLDRALREAADLGQTHEATPVSLVGASLALKKLPVDPNAQHLELYDVTDLLGQAEKLVDDIKNLRPDAWEGGAFIDLSVGLLRVRTTPDVHELIRAYLSTARGGGRRPSQAPRPHLDPLLKDPAGGTALLALAADCVRARAGLAEAGRSADAETRSRAKAVADRLEAPLKRSKDHDTHRWAVIERIRASWTRLGAGLEAAIRDAFAPCVATEVRVIDLDDPTLSDTHRAALLVRDGILVRPGDPTTAGMIDLALPDAILLFTLPRDGRPSRVASLRLTR